MRSLVIVRARCHNRGLTPLHARLLLFAIFVVCISVTASIIVFTSVSAPDRVVLVPPNGIPNLIGPLPQPPLALPSPSLEPRTVIRTEG
jgi:hypothetical protein